MQLALLGRAWRLEASRTLPEARGDIREIVGQPVFVPLFNLYRSERGGGCSCPYIHVGQCGGGAFVPLNADRPE